MVTMVSLVVNARHNGKVVYFCPERWVNVQKGRYSRLFPDNLLFFQVLSSHKCKNIECFVMNAAFYSV